MATPDRPHLHRHTRAFLERHGGSIHLLDIRGNNGGTAHISLDPTGNNLQVAESFLDFSAESQPENLLSIPGVQQTPGETQHTTRFSDRGEIINGLRRAMQTELDQLDKEIREARKNLSPERNAVVTFFTDQLRHPTYPGRYKYKDELHEDLRQINAIINTKIAARLSPWQIKQFELAFAKRLPEYIDEDPRRFANIDWNGNTVYIGIEHQPDYPLHQALEEANIDSNVFPHMTELVLKEGGTHPPRVVEWHQYDVPQMGGVIYPDPRSNDKRVIRAHPVQNFFQHLLRRD